MPWTLAAAALAAFLSAAAPASLFDQLWLLVSSSWNDLQTPDEGCGWDPNGRCLPAQDGSGSGLDPSGGSSPTRSQADEGCGWDPNGGCSPAP